MINQLLFQFICMRLPLTFAVEGVLIDVESQPLGFFHLLVEHGSLQTSVEMCFAAESQPSVCLCLAVMRRVRQDDLFAFVSRQQISKQKCADRGRRSKTRGLAIIENLLLLFLF